MGKKQKMARAELALVQSGSGFKVTYYNGATGTCLEPYFATRQEAEAQFWRLHAILSGAATEVEWMEGPNVN